MPFGRGGYNNGLLGPGPGFRERLMRQQVQDMPGRNNANGCETFFGPSGSEETHPRNHFTDFPSNDVFSHPSDKFRAKLSPDPEDFVPVVGRLCQTVGSQRATKGAGKWTSLTMSIVDKFNSSQQPREMILQKIDLWKEMYRALRTEFDCGICVFGSTFNGFGNDTSDIDMCLFPHDMFNDSKAFLSQARRILNKECRNFIKGGIELVPAKVPILKFFDREGRLEVDISVNNPTSIRNTHLLYCYSQADYRLRPMVVAVKFWAKSHNINEARLMTLSSYTITLMVIHYLQAGVTPPVLPCLQRSYSEVFHPNSDIFRLNYGQDLPQYKSQSIQSVGELLAGFFKYYSSQGKFNPSRDVGSVRLGCVLDAETCARYAKENKLGPGQWNAKLLLEEPFDRTNAARSVINAGKWKDIQQVFDATARRLKGNVNKVTLEELASDSVFRR